MSDTINNIEKIDKNFAVDAIINKDGAVFYRMPAEPFKIYGLIYEGGKLRRMPEAVAKTVSEGVYNLHTRTAGGRVRFCTDSSFVAISIKGTALNMSHVPLNGTAGLDLYIKENGKENYINTFMVPYGATNGYESRINLGERKMREITVNMPLYANADEFYIGLDEDATISEPTPYTYEKPIVYYGSSITQGGCASRAGNSYQGFISRRFDTNYINLGFSGNAKAEEEIAEYIASLDMSIFVFDYDHNTPTLEHLDVSHKRMFNIIREKHPDLPIIIMSAPYFYLNAGWTTRRNIIKETYDLAIKKGDKNVYFLDGPALMKIAENNGTVDNCHPNDLGFFSMSCALGDVIEKILKK